MRRPQLVPARNELVASGLDMIADVILRRFEEPDEVREFIKGRSHHE
jgi:hypothetical protein